MEELTTPILLNREKIEQGLSRSLQEQIEIEIWQSLPSTNSYLLHRKENTLYKPYHICLAEHQSAGRGRKTGRTWHSPFGCNLYFSCRTTLTGVCDELSLLVGLALIRTIKRYDETLPIHFSPPNDLIWQRKKLSGILIELMTRGERCDAIIGIGMNVNMVQPTERVDQPWVSLCQLCGYPIDRNQLVAGVITELIHLLQPFHQQGFSPFRDEWQQYAAQPE